MTVPLKRRSAILAAYGHVCHYCGIGGARTVDHIVPPSVGGSDLLGNLIACCKNCNSIKRNRRLPPADEAAALAKAEAMVATVLALEQSGDALPHQDGLRTVRLCLLLTATEAAELDRWRREHGMDSRAEAIRHCMHAGLDA